MINEKNLPHCYSVEAISTTIHIMNRIPIAVVHNMTLEEKFIGSKRDVGHIKMFGCTSLVHVPDELHTKLDPKAEKCVLVGYSLE